MAANPGTPAWGLLSGAAVGTLFGIVFSAPFAGPVVGILVGSRVINPKTGRIGAVDGCLMGAIIGALMGAHSLAYSHTPFEPVVWMNMIMASIMLYAAIGAVGGLLACWLIKLIGEGKYFL